MLEERLGNLLLKEHTQQTFPVFQDVFNTSSRRVQRNNFLFYKTSSRLLQDVFPIRLPKTSSRRLHKTPSRRFQNVFKPPSKTFSRRVSKTPSSRYFQDVFKKTSCNYALKTSSRRLQDVFSTSSPRRMFAGYILNISFA